MTYNVFGGTLNLAQLNPAYWGQSGYVMRPILNFGPPYPYLRNGLSYSYQILYTDRLYEVLPTSKKSPQKGRGYCHVTHLIFLLSP